MARYQQEQKHAESSRKDLESLRLSFQKELQQTRDALQQAHRELRKMSQQQSFANLVEQYSITEQDVDVIRLVDQYKDLVDEKGGVIESLQAQLVTTTSSNPQARDGVQAQVSSVVLNRLYDVLDPSIRNTVRTNRLDDNLLIAIASTVQHLRSSGRRSSLDISSLKAALVAQQRQISSGHEALAQERQERITVQTQRDSLFEVSKSKQRA